MRSIHPNSGIKQFDVIIANLNRELKAIENRTAEGLVRASIIVRNDTEKVPPLTPVDTGNLRASWFVVSVKGPIQDPQGLSGNFKNKPFKKMRVKASEMRANHESMLAAATAKIASISSPVVIMGYSANYAAFVHEKVDASFQRPGAGPKWFQAAIYSNKNKIVETVGKYAKIP